MHSNVITGYRQFPSNSWPLQSSSLVESRRELKAEVFSVDLDVGYLQYSFSQECTQMFKFFLTGRVTTLCAMHHSQKMEKIFI
jgi:hypothetical protein